MLLCLPVVMPDSLERGVSHNIFWKAKKYIPSIYTPKVWITSLNVFKSSNITLLEAFHHNVLVTKCRCGMNLKSFKLVNNKC